jgi:hypothetical protein
MPCTPASANAWRTSSSLNGLMTAVMSFISCTSMLYSCGDPLLPDAERLIGFHGANYS